MAYKTIHLGEFELTADNLRVIADSMDNPDKLLPFECYTPKDYAEKITLANSIKHDALNVEGEVKG